MNSIEKAEELAGGKMPDPTDPKEIEKMKKKDAQPNYHLADSDEEEDDAGDSTVETRRSVRRTENALKQRWFINSQEKRSFESKVASGSIRPEVLDFTDKTDDDYQMSAEEVIKKNVEKSKKQNEEAEAKVAEEAAKKETKEEKEEKEDVKAKEGASKALAEGEAVEEAKAEA